MKEKLREKIISILSDSKFPKNSEQIVYLFVQIRKLMDTDDGIHFKESNMLRFYANWLLHTNLDKKETEELLYKIGEEFKKNFCFAATKKGSDLCFFTNLILDFCELSDILGISNPLEKNHKWKTMISLMLNELINCPLQLKNNNKIISSFEFTEKKPDSFNYIYTYEGTPTNGIILIDLPKKK